MSRTIVIHNNQAKPYIPPKLHLKSINEGYRFHTMLKPSGSRCNIDCHYCFYLHKQDLLQQPSVPRMDDTVLGEHIRQYIEAQSGASEIIFTWQGGEPTLMGLDFFKRVLSLQQHYRPSNTLIYNDLQTNGLLLDDEWCAFLKQHDFMVGLSIDGPQVLHDKCRQTKNAKGTFSMVMRAVSLLKKHGVPFHALCVVNRYNADYPLEVYHFLRDEVSPRMIQFLAAVEPKDFINIIPALWQTIKAHTIDDAEPGSLVSEWSVLPEQWGNFLTYIWQEWLQHDFGHVFIDQFESSIVQALGKGYQKCTSAPMCGKALALEHNGDLYACDHFVFPEFKLGNILQHHEGDLAFSRKQQAFASLKYERLPDDCHHCDVFTSCYGDCPKDRFLTTSSGQAYLNYLCAGWKQFYRQLHQDLPSIRKRLNLA